jgi:hypothetical protein
MCQPFVSCCTNGNSAVQQDRPSSKSLGAFTRSLFTKFVKLTVFDDS